jgi:hypothetical protein
LWNSVEIAFVFAPALRSSGALGEPQAEVLDFLTRKGAATGNAPCRFWDSASAERPNQLISGDANGACHLPGRM